MFKFLLGRFGSISKNLSQEQEIFFPPNSQGGLDLRPATKVKESLPANNSVEWCLRNPILFSHQPSRWNMWDSWSHPFIRTSYPLSWMWKDICSSADLIMSNLSWRVGSRHDTPLHHPLWFKPSIPVVSYNQSIHHTSQLSLINLVNGCERSGTISW